MHTWGFCGGQEDNLVQDLSPLRGLRSLQVLRAARNQVQRLQGCVEGLDMLLTLDLQGNCIASCEEIFALHSCKLLHTLSLQGNPCCEVQGYRELVVAALPQLGVLDDVRITAEEKIKAQIVVASLRGGMEEQEEEGVKVPGR